MRTGKSEAAATRHVRNTGAVRLILIVILGADISLANVTVMITRAPQGFSFTSRDPVPSLGAATCVPCASSLSRGSERDESLVKKSEYSRVVREQETLVRQKAIPKSKKSCHS